MPVESPPSPVGPRSRLPFASPAIRGWVVAVTVYITAVFHRSALGVAGLQAAKRFGISPAQLSFFVLLQLGVYAAMQIPTGVLVDRYGPRRLLLAAAATMATAELVFAVAPNYPTALLARGLLGCGDALTFVSVLRFAAVHFHPRQYPIIVAATGLLGSVGAVLATLPLSVVLHAAGWTPTFAGAALVSVGSATLVWFVLPETVPLVGGQRRISELRAPARRVGARIRLAWSTPGTRLGFWVHFSCMSSATVFGVLWGVPYLVAQGYSLQRASAILLACVAVGIVASPSVGVLISRHAAWRVPLAIVVCVVTVTGWGLLLGFGGNHPPHALVAALSILTALGGPTSAIGFALARDYNRSSIVGTATGVVNVGGFVAAILGAALVGVTLSVSGGTSARDFRMAFAVLVTVQLVGTVQVVRWWRRARAVSIHAQRRGEAVPVPVVPHRWDLLPPASDVPVDAVTEVAVEVAELAARALDPTVNQVDRSS